MNQIQFLETQEFNIELSANKVLSMINCYPDSELYSQMEEEFEQLMGILKPGLWPKTAFVSGVVTSEMPDIGLEEGTEVIYLLSTIGASTERYSTEFFQQGDYVKGMLADKVADAYLFSMEVKNVEAVRAYCAGIHKGITKRLEAPSDIPMIAQKMIFDAVGAKNTLGMDIIESYMFNPVKSIGQIYVLTEDEKVFKAQHDCKSCKNMKCNMRNAGGSTIYVDGIGREIKCADGQTIMEALNENNIYISAVCGGKGKCGKCGIQLLEGELPITAADRQCLFNEDLEKGWRLSCMAKPQGNIKIRLLAGDESQFEIISEYEEPGCSKDNSDNTNPTALSCSYGIAIDIGTTTLAALLINLATGERLSSSATINKQRAYGADVISRIMASNQGKGKEMQSSIRRDLQYLVQELLSKSGINPKLVKAISIGGNTTMGHLLMGYSCEALGVVPFTPVNIHTIRASYDEIIGGGLLECPVTVLPGISTFVGGDIVSGLLACDFDMSDKISLFIDLGTNGEMALGNKDKILVASTAAGPAFEGGNISCGIGSIPGAICNVAIHNNKPEIRTIGDKSPVGICGTGVIETVCELLKEGLIDETGLLDEDHMDDGYLLAVSDSGKEIRFTQKDVREIQLAKSAIRAGLETLIVRYGISYEDIYTVYLAGGFGYKIDKVKAVEIGLLPKELLRRIKAIGNSSLNGAAKYLMMNDKEERLDYIISHAEEVELSTDKNFNEFYMQYMMFY